MGMECVDLTKLDGVINVVGGGGAIPIFVKRKQKRG